MSEEELFGPEFLIRRPLLDAIDSDGPVVLLIDEIDRADEEFEAFLLEILSDFQSTIPELGTVRARRKPAVVLTSNRTRELHDALKRRVLFHWIGHPSIEREVEIVLLRVPGSPSASRERRLRSSAASALSTSRSLRRRGDDRLGPGARRARARGDRRGRRRADARLGAQVPGGHRGGARRDPCRSRRRGAGRGDALGDARRRHGAARRDLWARAARGRDRGRAGQGRRCGARSRRRRPHAPDDVYFTLRQTLVSRHDELELFDRAFVAWFLRGPSRPSARGGAPLYAVPRRPGAHWSPARRARMRRSPWRSSARGLRRGAPREKASRRRLRGVRARAPAHGCDRVDPAAENSAAGCETHGVTASTFAASTGRRCAREGTGRAGLAGRADGTRKLVVLCGARARWTPMRGPCSSISTRRRHRARRGGVPVRHAPDAAHARPRHARPERRPRARRGGGRLGQRDASGLAGRAERGLR